MKNEESRNQKKAIKFLVHTHTYALSIYNGDYFLQQQQSKSELDKIQMDRSHFLGS